MFKVIVERPRVGGQYSGNRRIKNVDIEDLPIKEGMKKIYGERKELNENLAPLYRFIGSKVGQHWDKVYSEISQNLSVRSAVKQHVRDHLEDIIDIHTFVKNGIIYVTKKYYGGPVELKNSRKEYYVDPVTKIIKKNNFKKSKSQYRKEYKQYKIDHYNSHHRNIDGQRYRKDNGIWYKISYNTYQVPIYEVDRVLYVNQTDEIREQLNKKQLKILGLYNN